MHGVLKDKLVPLVGVEYKFDSSTNKKVIQDNHHKYNTLKNEHAFIFQVRPFPAGVYLFVKSHSNTLTRIMKIARVFMRLPYFKLLEFLFNFNPNPQYTSIYVLK
jgi:hypothetical protein